LKDIKQTIFKDFLSYLEGEKGYSRHTLVSYAHDLEVFNDYLLECFNENSDYLLKVDKLCLRSFLGSEFEKGHSSRTVARRLATIKSLFKYLVKAEYLEENPAIYVKTPKTPKNLPSFIQAPIIDKLMNIPSKETFIGLRDRAVLELFYSTGMRLSELTALSAGNFYWEKNLVKVLGKGNKERLIPFGDHAKSALDNYYHFQKTSLKTAPANAPVFTTKKGKRLSESSIQRRVRMYIALVADGERLGPHILRHSFATHMMDQGADIRAVKDLLGHSSLSSTQVYTHLQPEKMKKIYKKAHPHGSK